MLLFALLFVAPSVAVADTLGCAGGGLLLGAVGSQIGGGVGNKVFTGLGLLMGCSAGSRIEDGTYGKAAPTVTRKVTIVNAGGYQDTHRHDYGHHDDYRGRERRPSYFEDGYEEHRRSNIRPAVYTVEDVVEKPKKEPFGPTVFNYTSEKMIHPDCKTENPGADGWCLKRKAKILWNEQLACEGNVTTNVKPKVPCTAGKYNPGQWAGVYIRLGNELIARQAKIQGNVAIPE